MPNARKTVAKLGAKKNAKDVKDAGEKGTVATQEETVDSMFKTLTPYELSQLQLHQVKSQLQSNIIENLKMKLQMLALQYQNDQSVLKGQMKGAEDSRSEAHMDYNTMVAEIEGRLGIKMSEYVVDDRTGVLRHEDNLKQ